MTCLVAGFKLEITAVRSVVEKSTAGRFCAKLASWWHVWFVGFKEETTWRYYTGEPRPGWSKLVLLVAGYWTWLLKRFRGRWPGIRLEAHCSSSPEIRGLLRPENGWYRGLGRRRSTFRLVTILYGFIMECIWWWYIYEWYWYLLTLRPMGGDVSQAGRMLTSCNLGPFEVRIWRLGDYIHLHGHCEWLR